MKVRSRLAASLVAGLSLAICGLVHADASEYRYGPKDTLVKERAATSATASNKLAGKTQGAFARATQEVKDRGNPVFAAGPRNTILTKDASEGAMLSRTQ